jgi:hypothetical protein
MPASLRNGVLLRHVGMSMRGVRTIAVALSLLLVVTLISATPAIAAEADAQVTAGEDAEALTAEADPDSPSSAAEPCVVGVSEPTATPSASP